MRLLLVEDDQMIGEAVVDALRAGRYAVDWVRDGLVAERLLRSRAYDLVLLDLALPGRDGLDVLRNLRAARLRMPVIVVTARDSVEHRIAGLDAGADDFVSKPCDLGELLARVRALLRRVADGARPVYEHGGVSLNPVTREAAVGGQPVTLSQREWAVLEPLVARPGVVFSRAQLEQMIFGFGGQVASNAVEVYVHGLRKKLGSALIQNVRGLGYLVPRS